jgi:hypothetical protein
LAQTLLNGSCLGPTRYTRPIWSSIPPHDNDGHRLICRHLVRHPASFLSPLMPLPLRHPILSRGCGSRHLLPVFVQCQPRHQPAQRLFARPRGRFIVCGHHRFRRCRTSRLSSHPSPCSSSPTYCPRPQLQPRADRCSSTGVRGELVLLLAFLRVCHRGGHGGAYHA